MFHDALPPYRTSSLPRRLRPARLRPSSASSVSARRAARMLILPRAASQRLLSTPAHCTRAAVAASLEPQPALVQPPTPSAEPSPPRPTPNCSSPRCCSHLQESASHPGETHLSRRARVARHMGHHKGSHRSDCTRLLQLRICLQPEMCIYIPMIPYKAATRSPPLHTLPCSPSVLTYVLRWRHCSRCKSLPLHPPRPTDTLPCLHFLCLPCRLQPQ